MAVFHQVLYVVGVLTSTAISVPQGGPSPELENVPEECRPPRPVPGQQREVCCALPDPRFKGEEMKTVFEECSESLGIPPPPPPPGAEPPSGDRPPRPPGPPGHMACLEECVFNKLGLLTSDKNLNPETVTKKIMEDFGGETAWVPLIKEGVEKCIKTAPGSVRENADCKSGAFEMKNCIMKHLYMNCPSNLWTDTETCSAEKSRMEKCPNLHPRPPPPPPTSS